MPTTKVFLASSCELKSDRDQFEIFINRRNKEWQARGAFLQLEIWEDFLDAVSMTRSQDEYNRTIRGCDLFVMLFHSKVGRYTDEEFDTALAKFKAEGRPVLFTYFKDVPISTGSANRADLTSLWAFQNKLKTLGHFPTTYQNTEGLLLHFGQQLEKLAAKGFIAFERDEDGGAAATNYRATLSGNGGIAQGAGAVAVGSGGVFVGGTNAGNINTGTQTNIDTNGGAYVGGSVQAGGDFIGRDRISHGISPGELEPLFATLLAAVAKQTPTDTRTAAVAQVQELKSEVAKGEQADDGKIAKIVDGLTTMVPGAIAAVVSMFATPVLGGIVGPVTKYVLDKLKAD